MVGNVWRRKLGLCILFATCTTLFSHRSAEAQTVHYRSIGTNSANLVVAGTVISGSSSATITFNGVLLPANVGVGDKLHIDPAGPNEEILFILSRDSTTQVTVQTPTQFGHADDGFTLTRAYNTLQAWEDPCGAAPCLFDSLGGRGGDLAGEDRQEVGVAYNDGPFNAGVRFLDSTTDATHFMKLTVARGQRHDGTAGTGAIVTGDEIRIDDDFTVVEWLEVTGNQGAAWVAGVRLVDGTNALLSHLLIYGNENGIRISGTGVNHLTVRNCIVYGNDRLGIEGTSTNDTADVHNNTIYANGGAGVDAGTGTFDVVNTIAIGNLGGDFGFGTSTHDYNMSSDGSATGPNSIGFASAANEFQSLSPVDLHLKAGSDAINAGFDLSGSFTNDIDDDLRPTATWDMGADERSTDVPFFTTTSTSNQVLAEWENPSGACLGIRVARRELAPPTPTVYDWFQDLGCGIAGERGSAIDNDVALVNGTTYHYGIFVDAGAAGYTAGLFLKARPFDTSGSVKWAFSTADAAVAMAPPGLRFSGGQAFVYVVSNNGIVHAVKGGAAGGTWPAGWTPHQLGGATQSRPPVVGFPVGSAGQGVAFLGTQDGKVHAVDAASGDEVWSRDLGFVIQASPAGNFTAFDPVAKDLVFAGTRDNAGPNRLDALALHTGLPVWSFVNSTGPPQNGTGDAIGAISGSAAVDYPGQRLFFASRQNGGGSPKTVWCIDFTSGDPGLVWAVDIGDVDTSPVLVSGVIYVGTVAGDVYALDAMDGSVKWSRPLADFAVKSFVFPQFGSNNLIVSTNSKVWSIADNGGSSDVNVNWPVTTISAPSAPLFVPGTGEIIVGSGDGMLYQLDAFAPSPAGITLGDGAGVGAPTMDVLNSMIYVGSATGVVYGVSFPLF